MYADTCLPVEVWLLVWEQCEQAAVRCICQGAAPARLPTPRPRAIHHMLNHAAWDGNLQVLRWLFDTFHLKFQNGIGIGFSEFPAAFAIERGHLPVVKYLYTQHLPPTELQYMKKSIPFALQRGEFETVAWIVNTLEAEGITGLYHMFPTIRTSTLKECCTQRSCAPLAFQVRDNPLSLETWHLTGNAYPQ